MKMENNNVDVTLLTEEDYQYLKGELKGVGAYLPEHLANPVWIAYEKISGIKEPKPCMCRSSGGLWLKAVNVVNDYISKRG
jgi:hypothetical protein